MVLNEWPKRRNKTRIRFIVMTLIVLYCCAAVVSQRSLKRPFFDTAVARTTPQSQPGATADVPNGVFAGVKQVASRISGLDELVVFPSETKQRYSVSATVDLGNSQPVARMLSSGIIQADTDRFLRGVLLAEPSIENVELYFMSNGQIVAGAGLGRLAYEALSISTSTREGAFVQALAAKPAVADGGNKDKWLSISGRETS